MQISLAEAELRPNESPAKNTASYCIVLRHIVKVLDRSTPVFHLSKSNLPSLPDDTIPATLAHISAALSSRPIFSPYSFYPLHRPYICPARLYRTSDALPPRLSSFRRPASPRAASVSPRIPKCRLCQYPALPSRPFRAAPFRLAPPSRHAQSSRAACTLRPFRSTSSPPRHSQFSPYIHFSLRPCIPLPVRAALTSRPLRFMSSCRSRTASPRHGVSANIHSAYRKIFSTPLFLVSPSAQLSPSRAASHFLHRMNSVAPPLSPCWDVPSPLLDARSSRAQVRSLSFLSLSCAFLLVPQCSQHPFFSLCSMIAYFLRRENT